MLLTKWVKYALLAIQFLTRLPINIKGSVSPRDLGKATAAFPVVGLIIGGVLALIYYVAALVLPVTITCLLAILVLVGINGGLHLDGLMDTADGIFSGRSRERTLEIMKDSRVGAMGVIACVLLLVSKLTLLVEIPPPEVYRILLIFPVLSRWMMVWALVAYPYARVGEGTGRPFCEQVGTAELIISSIITLALVVACSGLAGIILVLGAGLTGLVVAWFLNRRLQGLTGDTYGAINELVEVMVLMLAVVMTGYGWLA